jgi:peroxiredoxin
MSGALAVIPALHPLTADDQLRVGDAAPDFTLPCATKDTIDRAGITLSQAIGHGNIILAFYPADWSGGCTTEVCTMRDNFGALGELNTRVFGISGDYVFSHHEWAKFHNLQFPLLSDHNHAVAQRYSSYNHETGYNLRTVYVLDGRGLIAYIDLAYKAGSQESFDRLKAALRALN